MGSISIFVGNNLIIDFDIYQLWIDGYSTDECKDIILKKDPSSREVRESVVVSDIIDNFCTFNRFEQFLYNPIRLKEQLLYQIPSDDLNKLIEKYYQYDPIVIREILGHKLTQRHRKDLDDVCEKTDVRVKSCRRQFDNLKRIMRVTEDMKGPLVKSIIENFHLPNKMAEEYAAIVFLTKNQFDLSKKKLNHLTTDDFIYCANLITKNWSSNVLSSLESESDISRDFLINLKDLRILVEKDFIEDHKKLVITSVCKVLGVTRDNRSVQLLDYSFKELSKALMDIAYALNHSKDMRDLFYDLEEKFIEPCKEGNLPRADLKVFLDEYRKRAHMLQDICRDNPKFLSVFDRYIIPVSNCILQMYHF